MTINSFVSSDKNSFLSAYKIQLTDNKKELTMVLTTQNVYTFDYTKVADKEKLKKTIWCTSLSNLVFSTEPNRPTILNGKLTAECTAHNEKNKIKQGTIMFRMTSYEEVTEAIQIYHSLNKQLDQ